MRPCTNSENKVGSCKSSAELAYEFFFFFGITWTDSNLKSLSPRDDAGKNELKVGVVLVIWLVGFLEFLNFTDYQRLPFWLCLEYFLSKVFITQEIGIFISHFNKEYKNIHAMWPGEVPGIFYMFPTWFAAHSLWSSLGTTAF